MSEWPDFDLKARCPICGARHDGTANTVDDLPPQDGNLALCIVCGGISIYELALPEKLRFPTDAELVEIMNDPDIAELQRAHREVIRRHGLPKGNYFPD